ncbi:DEAD/DEAH box helicase [Gulosibacter molinativorax]|uniref:ATP-dependent helicase n=1 Tax=Gulosibacter molinativorax TaxID=256821 RepID=A0ABT7C3K5_9MICO|nr:DEAD/DEAH box helicase [Gulosibacter molinativorax]MDJ1369842.1 ATP-dependent helicase [Gulosibacter molinativorax]QUY61807.1 RNA polymerase-associated protein RapA [Gulosibacter molinativorax]
MTPKTRSRLNQHASRRRQRNPLDNTGIIPQLAKAAREVEAAAARGRVSPANRTKFQVAALLMREERTRLKTDTSVTDKERDESMKRLDGLAAILAKTAARDTTLIALLDAKAPTTPQARELRKQMLFAGGVDMVVDEPVEEEAPKEGFEQKILERQVLPVSVKSRVRSSPFLAPDLSKIRPLEEHYSRLRNWELLSSLLKAFETGAGGGAASMDLPESPRFDRVAPQGQELMPHQAQLIESVREGHRTFLLADEPGLGKTAQSILAASVADAFPLLCVVPNVVKTNWQQEVERWTPGRRATVISGDGNDVDAFSDVFIVNYEILDRHIGWLRKIGFRGMVVDEAHFIKNLQSQRSRLVLQLAQSIRQHIPGVEPLLMALTGTPLINDVEDFKAIWQFLGWLDGDKPAPTLMDALDETGLVPSDAGFLAAGRRAVIDQGIVRRRKIDVAKSLPSKRIIDMPVELDSEEGNSIRKSERLLVERLLGRYDRMIAAADLPADTVDENRLRMLARQEIEESKVSSAGDSIFSMLHRIGVAKSELAAEYTAQLAHSVGKVVFFAKHIEAMDRAQAVFEREGVRTVSIRGDQTQVARDRAIESFQKDSEVQVIICSLMAAGVGINLQVASDVVLAELSWTAAEQTQAIDRVHRIGQDEPVTAWRILASQTIDVHVAELIDSKQGLAARALEGTDEGEIQSEDIQVEAIVKMLLRGLEHRLGN